MALRGRGALLCSARGLEAGECSQRLHGSMAECEALITTLIDSGRPFNLCAAEGEWKSDNYISHRNYHSPARRRE